MLNLQDPFCVFCKIYFDGHDFLQTDFGQMLVPKDMHPIIDSITYLEELYKPDEFVQYCKSEGNYILPSLMDKYNVGSYKLSQCNHKDNPCRNTDYILFNKFQIQKMFSHKVSDLDFWVCPAYNEDGHVEDIGFRIKDTSKVNNAFKWLFPRGNNIIYGKNTVNKDEKCYVVEGFRDYVALNESGYNCIGLGSVFLSDKQKQYINTLKEPILLLDNDKFGRQQALEFSKDYRVATLIGTEEKDAYDAYKKGLTLNIVEILN